MATWRCGLIAMLLLSIDAEADKAISHYGGGGTLRSPDGRWRVWSRPPDADERDTARLWLAGPGVRRRLLLRYERAVEAIWLTDRRRVLIRTQTAHFARLALFDLGPRDRAVPLPMQAQIERAMVDRSPRLASIENREIVFGRPMSRTICVLVREAGLPPGRMEGSFVVRLGSFRLDPVRAEVMPVARCPGAVFPG